jgi:hypothetical protein
MRPLRTSLLFLGFLCAATFALESEAASSTLSVRISPFSIGSIPRGAQRVRFLSLHFIASCDAAISIREIRAHHYGFGDVSDLKGAYLLKGVERLTRSQKIASADQTVTLRPKNLSIPQCGHLTLDIAGDFEANATVGSQHRFEVKTPEDLVTDADALTGNFPLQNVLRTRVSPLPAGQITITFLPVTGSLSALSEHTLSKMQISADNESDHLLYGVTLTNEGSAKDADIRLIYLRTKQGRGPLTNIRSKMDGKEVLLRFTSPYLLERGKPILFELRGRPYTRTKTMRFTLKEESDLDAVPLERGRRRERGGQVR